MLEQHLCGLRSLHSRTICSACTSAGNGTRGIPGYRQSEAAMPGPSVVAWYRPRCGGNGQELCSLPAQCENGPTCPTASAITDLAF